MCDVQYIDEQKERLATYRQRLAIQLKQQAETGSSFSPPATISGIFEARNSIRQIKENLRKCNVVVEDYPDDNPIQQTSSKLSNTGLQALVDLISELTTVPEGRGAIAVYKDSFETTRHQIKVLRDHKNLHDLLQQIDDPYSMVARSSKNILDGPLSWGYIEDDEPALYDKIDELLIFAERDAVFKNETVIWTPILRHAQKDLRSALENHSADLLKKALWRIKNVIDSQISRADASLKEAAKSLRLSSVVVELRKIDDLLVNLSLDNVKLYSLDEFRRGIQDLDELNKYLNRSITLHTIFQSFDDQLRLIEVLLDHDMNELIETWHVVSPMMELFRNYSSEQWINELSTRGAELERAIATNDPDKIRRSFVRYRTYATTSFNQIDARLLLLCDDLQLRLVGVTLDGVLRMIE